MVNSLIIALVLQVDHLPEVKELADDGDWAIRIPTTVVIELEVNCDEDDIDEIPYHDYYGDWRGEDFND